MPVLVKKGCLDSKRIMNILEYILLYKVIVQIKQSGNIF
jgi:hypothetical protein